MLLIENVMKINSNIANENAAQLQMSYFAAAWE